VTGDGNLLLNVGPMPDGRIEPRQVEVLRQIGAWLRKYGESIYATRGGPFRNGTWGGSTYEGKTVYLHVLSWDNNRLELPPLPKRIVRSTLLTGGAAVKVVQDEKKIVVTRRSGKEEEGDVIIRLEFDSPVEDMDVVDVPAKKTLENVSVTLANEPDQPFVGHEAGSLVDGMRGTTDRMDGRWLGFLGGQCEAVIDLRDARILSSVTVGCLQEQVSRIFYPTAIEVAGSDDGQSFRDVGRIDNGHPRLDAEIHTRDFTVSFSPITVRFLRVRVLNAVVCPPWHNAAGNKAWILLDEISVK
jgi:Alpha-L-fucosidase